MGVTNHVGLDAILVFVWIVHLDGQVSTPRDHSFIQGQDLGGEVDRREATDDVGVEVSQLVKWVMSRLLAGHVQRVVSQMKKTHEQVKPDPWTSTFGRRGSL